MDNQEEILDSGMLEATSDVEEQKIINLNKFMFLCIVSFGTYHIWWTFKAWKFFRQKEKSDIIPAARALFSIFFLNALFNKILDFAKEKGSNDDYPCTALFIGFILVNFSSRLPDPYWLVSLLSFVFFIPPFKALNFAKQNSSEYFVTEQTSFNNRQIGLIIIGLVFWAFVIIGLSDDVIFSE